MPRSSRRNQGLHLALLLLLGSLKEIAGATPWLQENFPNPDRDSTACRGRICDPDGVLNESGLDRLQAFLQTNAYMEVTKDCRVQGTATSETTEDTATTDAQTVELQMGVALVKKMDLTPFGGDDSKDRAAETFARYVHDDWGVGVETESCGGAGVLLFLSIEDRTIYLSRGAALEGTLTDRRVDGVIDNMKDLLRSEEYDNAILQALQDMQQYIAEGPPTSYENFMYTVLNVLFPAVWLMAVLGSVGRNIWVNSRMQREYARVKSQLSEIDRARAEALQGRYQCTSCPICLEDFAPPETEGGVATVGSDGQPIKLLRCGHCMDETCWAEWISSGRGTITKCPICMQDIGVSTENTNQTNPQQQAPARRDVHENNHNHNNELANWEDEEEDRAMRRYRRDRLFRLARLGNRYPRIVNQAQIQRWSNPTYEGQLVRDPGFVQSNPTLVRPASGGSRGMSSGGGFGGSSSGGGRGGSW